MEVAPLHSREKERLQAVQGLNILDTPVDERFEALTREAKARFGVSMSAVTILDATREWYKSCAGEICPIERQGGRNESFCSHALLAEHIFIVADTLEDARFADNPMVINPPYIRFYAGVALLERKSHLPVGVFCIKDTSPRKLSTRDIGDLLDLAHRAEALL